MNHLRAFASSISSAARDITKDLQSSYEETARATGRQYKIGSRTVQEERLLSEGGFGFVYLVRDVTSGAPYVVKKILCQDRERFEVACREVELFEKLPVHPNLVKYYGHTVEKSDARNREVVILMEYCPGGHLYDMMQKHGSAVPKDAIMKALRDVTAGLLALQSMSPPVQHRDLKLENVLLSSSGNYVLVDFGSWSSEAPDTSNLPREALLKFGDTVERYTTLMYRPPEMADLYKGFKISGKVDMWTMGCILFTLLNNKHPFQDASNLAIVNCRYSFSQDDCKRYPAKLIELCLWLLAQNPEDRPDAYQLNQLLSDWDEEVPLPLPKSVIDRIEKDARLYGIPSMTRRPRKKSSQVENTWTNNAQSSQSWQADFPAPTFGDLLDLSAPAQKKEDSSSLPDLLG